MAGLSQSHFLQSLGWATLNSFWQMALLWSFYLGASYLLKISSHRKYQLSVGAIVTGFVWFIFTFCIFYQNRAVSTLSLFDHSIQQSDNLLNVFLLSASVAYLSLLIFPAYKLYSNWRFVQKIKKEGLGKANYNYRLFVQKIAGQLGIKKKVLVFISDLVKSPVTVGYLKPIILLPIAALNNLSTQQVEAVLLHELSHIRRYDYLINLIVSIIHTLLYFNPFVKQFIKIIEEERENCCDELVIHYGYDKVGYASALLTLEKAASKQHTLAMSATGKKNLLNRIEKIVGMEKKNGFKLNHFTGLLAALFFIVVFNSVLIIKEEKKGNRSFSFAYTDVTNPFHYFESEDAIPVNSIPVPAERTFNLVAITTKTATTPHIRKVAPSSVIDALPETDQNKDDNPTMNVDFNEVDGLLTDDQKEEVKTTVDATKKVVSSLQWQEVENNIADAMTQQEKTKAKQEYLKELDKTINWKNIEENLKSNYQEVDWTRIKTNLSNALTIVQLDSLERNYSNILSQLDKSKTDACDQAKVATSPLPDQSVEQINTSRKELKKALGVIKAIRTKKIVRL